MSETLGWRMLCEGRDAVQPQTPIALNLLAYRRQRGLLAAMSARVTLTFLGALAYIHDPPSAVIAVAIVLPSVLLWFVVKRGQWLFPIGITTAILDGLVLALIPFFWLATNEGSETLRLANMLNTHILLVGSCALMVLNSLALEPLFPLIVGGTFILGRIGLLGFVAAAGGLATTDSFLVANTSSAIHPAQFATDLTIVGFVSITLALLIRSSRRTIYRAVYLEKANSQLARYFSPDVAQHLTMMTETAMGPGQLVEATILFSDIRGFTGISEQLTPRQTMSLLADYHERMVAAIFKHGGTLDKFLGDGIMATFGTPASKGNDADNAVQAALAMDRALEELNAKRRERGLTEIEHRIGIHYGPVIAGNVGTAQRMEYTVIGDTVNIASRVEGACKELGVSLLITESVRLQLDGRYEVESLGEVEVRGKSAPLRLYTVCAPRDPT